MADFEGAIATKIVDAADPTKVLSIDSNGAAKVTGDLTVSGGSITIDNTNITVVASDLDIRNLTVALDTVGIGSGTNVLSVDTNGSASVHVDNTSFAVTGSDFDIRNLTAATDTVSIAAGSNALAIDSNGAIAVSSVGGTVTVGGSVSVSNTVAVSASSLDIRPITSATDSIAVSGTVSLASNTSVAVTASDLDIRNLTAATDVVTIGSGTNTLAIDSNGYATVNVVAAASGTMVTAYGASSNDVAKNGTFTFDSVVTSGKTFTGNDICVGSRAACKVQIGSWNGTAFTALRTFFQQPSVNDSMPIGSLSVVGDGTKAVRVIVTNLDQATTLYCSITGSEI